MFEEKSKDLIDELAKKEQVIHDTQKKLEEQNKLIEELKRRLQKE